VLKKNGGDKLPDEANEAAKETEEAKAPTEELTSEEQKLKEFVEWVRKRDSPLPPGETEIGKLVSRIPQDSGGAVIIGEIRIVWPLPSPNPSPGALYILLESKYGRLTESITELKTGIYHPAECLTLKQWRFIEDYIKSSCFAPEVEI